MIAVPGNMEKELLACQVSVYEHSSMKSAYSTKLCFHLLITPSELTPACSHLSTEQG